MWRLSRRRKIAIAIVLSAYLGFFMAGGCADRFVLYPSTHRISAPGAEHIDLPFAGGKLETWVSRSDGLNGRQPDAFILCFGGNADRAEWHVQDVHDWDAAAVEQWFVNYPGYGGSTGPAELDSIGPASLAAYDALADRAKGRPVFVQGVSLGTTAALYVAAHRKPAGMVLRSPPPLRDLVLGRHGWWNLWILALPVASGIPASLNSIDNARKSAVPAVFVLTEIDEVVPIHYQQRVADAYAGPKRIVMSRSMHNEPLTPACEGELRSARQWLQSIRGIESTARNARPGAW